MIYPKLQLGLLSLNFVVLAGTAVAVSLAIRHSIKNLIDQGMEARLPINNPYFTFMAYQQKLIVGYVAIGIAAAFVLSSIFTLILSHRVAGPLVRLKNYLSEVASGAGTGSGPLPELKFRRGDFFGTLPGLVNAAFEAVRKGRKKG